ncbi:aminopeptidase [Aestuariirhabdus sp. Z084]|uniref:aminopeptidase n=1 Tax=Aestuariirhabdus haliotis TaxID=2918751 RepID=UPI00201B3B99|nr:aminopeptidase [Aestuariirhabdus haliotis]MCL6414592.1 aminopeptidase [Aestuariirhabdus haliotis]MCL6418426.1 aminopeptidase [Aestuariirhabdus haliotis]
MDRYSHLKPWQGLSVVITLGFFLTGCESLSYYWQAGQGQWQIQRESQSVSELIASPDTPTQLRQRLSLSQEILKFAHKTLDLPDNGSYQHYADLERPFVVWNLFASEEFSTDLHRWCYPVAGCLHYRGYFDPEDAKQAAINYQQQGFDTWIGGVRAYSTLGWFKDPLLNTFVFDDELQLAELIFHELAHQKVFAKGDTAFNESLATVIAAEGTRRWAAQHQLIYDSSAVMADINARQNFSNLVQNTREQLSRLYQQALTTKEMRQTKQQLLDTLRHEYQQRRQGEWQSFDRFDQWMTGPLNNAKLGTIASYYQWVPLFEHRLKALGRDLPAFYDQLQTLAKLPEETRQQELHKMHSLYNQ